MIVRGLTASAAWRSRPLANVRNTNIGGETPRYRTVRADYAPGSVLRHQLRGRPASDMASSCEPMKAASHQNAESMKP